MRDPIRSLPFSGLGTLALLALAPGASGDVVFTDVTAQANIAITHQPRPLGVPAANEWMMAGACVGDFNRDGWPDVFVITGGMGPDHLLINQGNGTFADKANLWGVAASECGIGTAVGDVDHDGWPDIYLTSYGNGNNNQGELGKHRLYRNSGNQSFTDIAVAAGVNQNSTVVSAGDGVCWGDYDLDGDLDLAVTAWSLTANGNRLYRNNGNNTFTDVTGTAISIPLVTWGFQCGFADFDGDRYPELCISADFSTSGFYHNNRNGTFTNTTTLSGAGIDKNGMGQCIADLDGDGFLDWYVTSIYQDIPSNPRAKNGNAFYRGNGNATFDEISEENGTQDGGWGWATVAGDFDQDGRLDMVEVNGRNAGEWAEEPEYYFRNLGSGQFLRDEAVSSSFLAGDARTAVTLDYDRDGDLDVLIYYNQGPLKLYRNDSTEQGNWLEVKIDSPVASRVPSFGYGVRVVAKVGAVERVRYIDGGNGYLGSSELMAHFGLGGAMLVDSLRFEWPRGNSTTLTNVHVNQAMVVTAPRAADLDADGVVGPSDLTLLLGHFGPVGPLERYLDIDDDGVVGPRDLALLLGAWTP